MSEGIRTGLQGIPLQNQKKSPLKNPPGEQAQGLTRNAGRVNNNLDILLKRYEEIIKLAPVCN